MPRFVDECLKNLLLAAGIYGAAFSAASWFESWNFAAAILPNCGIAFGALFRWGFRRWPGAWLGILIALAQGPRVTAAGEEFLRVSPAMVAESFLVTGVLMAGVWALKAWTGSSRPMRRIRDTLIFIAVALATSLPIVTVKILLSGAGALMEKGLQQGALVLYLSDLLGILVLAPLFFIQWQWTGDGNRKQRVLELVLLLALFFATSQVVFGTWLDFPHYPLVYLLFPFLIWAAGRFGKPGALVTVLVVSLVAIDGTLQGWGPFAERSISESIMLLQCYLLVVSLMTLVFSAAVTQTRFAEDCSTRLGRILDHSSNEIYVMDAETFEIHEANLGALHNLGYSLDELFGRVPHQLNPELTVRNLRRKVAPLLNGSEQEVELETAFRRRDGSEYPVEVRIRLSEVDSQKVLVAFVQDLTLKKETEQRLKVIEQRFQQVVHNMIDVFWMVDLSDGRVVYVSPSYLKVWGHSEETIYADPRSWLQSVHDADLERVKGAFPGDISKGGSMDLEYRIVLGDGTVRWIWDRAFPVPDESGRILHAARFSADVTEKKHALMELNLYRNHLEELVRKRTDALEATHRQLLHAEKLSASGKLAASMAHEFNSPIYGIRSILEKIQRHLKLDAKFARFVDLAIRECDRISNLIHKMMAFHRPSSEVREWVDIHEMIEDVLILMGKKFQERRIELETRLFQDLPPVEVVPDQIQQVLLNLLQNAEEAIPSSGGRILLETAVQGNHLEVRIRDTGNGMRPETLKNIFDPFFTTKSEVKGTGLGLSVSYGIVQMHDGEIRVESQPGQGSQFTLVLPLESRSASKVPAASEAGRPKSRNINGR